ncbi:y4mF family transcriptional regulator [Rhodovulum bhavnagarense]|uniref:Y4mF family transcriptional regulator n=1 Tax=Rhodovulum bhavnagarense TaxID=992286 RepID=A0A4R2RH54_9RHOB|nr:helix-turn-helix domain-containing protein [Rhodovulum bhavnagarense]TCP61447.1 y4mF family transcriptional regulator [Rhodovulum bhavnagarense]
MSIPTAPAIPVCDPASLGRAIRKTRKALKITQEDLSLQTGISRTTIRAIEHGKESAHVGLVMQVCRDLGITISLTPPGSEQIP